MDSITDSKWFLYLICVVLLAFGTVCTYQGAQRILQHRASVTEFLPMGVRILSHDLDRDVEQLGYSSGYMPVISYEYEVDGQIYESDTVLTVPFHGEKEWAEDILAQFPIGSVQQAYYNPASPEQTYLIESTSPDGYVFLILGLVLFLFGSAMLIQTLWKAVRR